MLAHELRNPLAPVLNAVQFLAMSNGAPEPTAANVEAARNIIDQQVRQMARIVDDLLDVSRITRGRIALRLEAVDLTALVSKAIESNRPQFVSREHRLTASLPEGPLTVRGDITRLEQVIANLLNNAAKYTADGGNISVTLDRHGDRARLSVRDNGVGISPDMLPRIFDLFTQAEQSLARSHGGLGIGLTLVHRLVELHGGTVAAQSPGLNQGSEFTVELPLIVTAAPELQPNISDACPAAPRRRVLVVDDNVDAANSLAMLLSAAGHDARAAYNGPEALDHVAASPPEVVFLDIGLPGMDGFEVARRLRSGAKSPPLLLVALTGYGQPEDRESTRRAGFDRHLVKPVTLDRLENLLRDLDKQ
jgi:two-component system, chemotaxis family, CheB/CheR fusion protein